MRIGQSCQRHKIDPIGRKNDLNELSALLSNPAIRLVNIQGPGGIGKTRLAIEAAGGQSEVFADGVYFVSLAALADPHLLATAMAKAINFSIQGQSQQNKREKSYQDKQLLAYLRNKNIMLVLDNIEHLLDGLPLLTGLLQIAPSLKIMTTSRERLGLLGETVYPLGSMSVPEKLAGGASVNIEDHEALQLFVTCAERSQPRFELNAENVNEIITICQLVDGLPLGIELAAAWMGLLTPGEIAAEIKSNLDFLSSHYHDLPERQQSIRSVFESSWSRLTKVEQGVYQQLSVFRGGFSRRAAESVTGAKLPILMALVNKSLVQPDYTGRYHIHELLRQYGSEKLSESGEKEGTIDRHFEFFLKLAVEAEPQVSGPEQVRWLGQLELELDNLRAAMEWGRTAKGKAESGLLLTGSLVTFWSSRGYHDEGREHLSAALSRPGASARTAARAKALSHAGLLAYIQSDYPKTRLLLEESLSIYRELGPCGRLGLANALITLGDMKTEVGEYRAAASMMKEALVIMRELEDVAGISRALWQLGQCAVRPGDYEEAVKYFEQALPLLRQLGDTLHVAITLSGLAEVEVRQGEYERAIVLEEESLALRREIGEPWGMAVSLGNFAWIALRQDDLPRAMGLLSESLTLRGEFGDRGGVAWCLEKMAEIALIRGQRASDPRRQEDFRRAARLFGAAEALRAPVNSKIDQVDQPEYERQLTLVRDHLDKTTFAAGWGEGQAMTLRQAVDYALADQGRGDGES